MAVSAAQGAVISVSVDGVDTSQQQINGLSQSMNGLANTIQADQVNIVAAINRTTMAMQAGGTQTSAYYELLGKARGIDASVLAPYISQLRAVEQEQAAAGHSTEEFGFKTAAAKRELLVLTHELSQGNFKKFGGSLMVIAEQTGAAEMLFSAAGLAAIGFTAAVVGVGTAIVKGAQEQKAMDDALIMTGGYAGVTSDSLNAMAHAAVETGGSIGVAKEAVTALAGTGKFTAAQIGTITDAAVVMEHATGQSVEKTIEQFQSLAVQTSGDTLRSTEAISKAALKLDDTYHFLTESVYEQIRAYEKEGDQKAASAVATDALSKVTKDRGEEMVANLGYVARAWNGVKDAIGGVVDAVGNLGKKATPGSEVEKYSNALTNFDRMTAADRQRNGIGAGVVNAGDEKMRASIVADLTKAIIAKNAADAAAIEQGKKAKAESEAMHAASRIEQDDIKQQKKGMTELQVAIQEYGQDMAKIAAVNPASPLLSQDAVNAHMAALVKAHTKSATGTDTRAQVLQDQITIEQTALDSEKSIYDARAKMLDTYHSKFGLSDAEFYAGRQAARADYIAAEAIAFAKESALVQAAQAQAKNPQEVAAAKGKYDELLKAHQKFVDDMRNNAGQDDAATAAAVQKSYDDIAKSTHDAGVAAITSLDQQIAKQREHNAEIGKTREQIELARQAQTDLGTAQLESDAAYLRDGLAKWQLDDKSLAIYTMRLSDLDAEIARRKTLSGLQAQGSTLENAAAAEAASKKLAAQAIQDWKEAGSSIADSLSTAFGSGGKAIGQMFKAYADGVSGQLKAQKELTEAKALLDTDPEKIDAINRAQLQGAQAQVKSYGDMAQAAQGFFDQGSTGYRAMAAASEVLRVAEIGLSLVKGVNAVLTQGEGDPYTAFGRMAAMAAVVAGLGVAIGGIGGSASTTAADRQKAQGAGTVLGDSSAKSDSIAHAIQLSAANSSTQINYLSGMLTALQGIETNIGSFASQLVQSTDISNPKVGLNTNNGLATTAASAGLTAGGAVVGGMAGAGLSAFTAMGAVGGPLGMAAGALLGYLASKSAFVGKIATSIFGGKQSVDDSGFTLGKASLAALVANGAKASQYADITTSGGWFSSDKHNTQTTALSADANAQITAVIGSLGDSIKQAGTLLGMNGDDFTAKLNSFVVDIGKVSLKGMTGDEIQKTLESVFSKLGDQMAQYAVGGLSQFAKVGEGYLETLVRVASDYAKVDASMQSIGKTFGSVGIASIGAREDLIALMGGIDNFQSTTADFAKNFLTKAQQLAPVAAYVSQQLATMNLGWVQTDEQFRDVVLGLDLTTTAGQQTYAALMGLEGAFAATHEAIVDTSKSAQDIADERKGLQDQLDQLTMNSAQLLAKQRDALDASNQALFDQVQAAQKVKDAQDAAKTSLGDFITQMTSFATTAKGLNGRLLLGNLSTLTPEQQLAEARKQFEQTRQAAAGGDATAQGNLQSIEQTFLQLSQKLNGSDAAYSSDLATVMQTNDQLATWATSSANVAQSSLDALNDSNATLTDISATLSSIAQGVQYLPEVLAGVDSSGFTQAFSGLDYSQMGTTGMTALVDEIKALRASNDALTAEVKGLRADQQQQTGDQITAGATAAAQAAAAVVDGVRGIATDAVYALNNSTRALK